MKIEITETIKVVESSRYLLVMECTNGVRHYWLHDGTYDGCCKPHRPALARRIWDRIQRAT